MQLKLGSAVGGLFSFSMTKSAASVQEETAQPTPLGDHPKKQTTDHPDPQSHLIQQKLVVPLFLVGCMTL
jgi:hypothetical protein